MRKPYGFAFGALLVASVVFLSAQVGGFPSRPRFQSVGVGMTNVATGTLKAKGPNQQLQAHGDAVGDANVSYVSFNDSGGTRTGYIGDSDATANFEFANERTNGSINLVSNGTGVVQVNGATIPPRVCKVKAADTARASDIVPSADPNLSNWVTVASTTYVIDGVLIASAGSAIDFRFQLESTGTPVTPLAVGVINTLPTQALGNAESMTVINENSADLNTEASGGMNVLRLNGPYTTSATGTDFDFEWSQVTSNASATTLRAGSYLCLTPLLSMD